MNLMQKVLGAARDRVCDLPQAELTPHTPRAVLGNLSQQPRTPNAHTPAAATTPAAPALTLRVLSDAPATEKPARRTGVTAQRRGAQSAVKSAPGAEPRCRSSRRAAAPLEPAAASMAHRSSRTATPALAEATAAEEQAVATLVAAAVERVVDAAAAVEVMKAMEATHSAAAKSPSMRRLKKQLKEAHLVRRVPYTRRLQSLAHAHQVDGGCDGCPRRRSSVDAGSCWALRRRRRRQREARAKHIR